MAGSQRNQRQHVDLPRNWRLISAVGLTAFGLACGVSHPARGDWWSLPRIKSSSNAAAPKSAGSRATAARSRETRPSATDNGFSATIRRLQADARHQAEQGDLDRAVQLAERAAKISDASSQLNGSAPDCSPEQTARFANDLRSRRDAMAGRGHPGGAAPQMAAAAPRTSTTISPKSDALMGSPVARSEEVLIESARDHSQPTNRLTNSNEQDLAGASDLPPTPAPEVEPFQTPTKFRRIVLNRTAIESDEPDVESRILPDGRLVVSQPGDVIGEPFDLNGDLEQPPIEVATTHMNEASENRRAARPETSAPVEESLREPFRDQIQHVADEESAEESSPFNRKLEWEDEDLNTEPVRSAKPTVSSVKQATPVVSRSADRTEKPADTKPNGSETEDTAQESFPIQRVVQLRRRLESAASLNPGGAFTLPAQGGPSPSTGESSRTGAASPPSSTAKSSMTIPAETGDAMLERFANPSSADPAGDWNREPVAMKSEVRSSTVSTRRSRSSLDVAPPAVTTPGPASRPERQLVKLREHRQQSGTIPQAPADVLPPVHSTRRHAVGFSEPILWQSAEERGSVAPVLSLVSDIRSRDGGTRLASATAPSADLRDAARAGERSRTSNTLDNSFPSPASNAETPHFDSIELPADEPQDVGADAPVWFASSQSLMADGPALDATNSSTPGAVATAPSQSLARKKKASHGVSRQSFALIEPLAASLKLPVATTATLLGCAGFVLLGFGLILLRAAFRWRHVG